MNSVLKRCEERIAEKGIKIHPFTQVPKKIRIFVCPGGQSGERGRERNRVRKPGKPTEVHTWVKKGEKNTTTEHNMRLEKAGRSKT